MHIREIKVDDAENFVNLVKQVENESPFMLMEAGERETTALQQRKQLENLKQQNHSTIFNYWTMWKCSRKWLKQGKQQWDILHKTICNKVLLPSLMM